MPCCPEYTELREMVMSFARSVSLFERGQMSCFGLTPQQAYTLSLIGDSESNNMGDLSERLGIATSTLTRNIEKLEQANLVARNRTSTDARAVEVLLTDEGRARLAQVEECYESFFMKLLDSIEPTDRKEVIRALRILFSAIQKCNCY